MHARIRSLGFAFSCLALAAASCLPAHSQLPAPSQPPVQTQRQPSAFDTLPLHPPETGPSIARTAAIFMTGDGGWAPFDTKVSADMSAAGVPTVGFDTGTYFSTMRSPEEAAVALGQAIEATLQRYKADRIILVGYSFGADVGPFLFNRLAPELRQYVDRIALMSPSAEAPFQVTLAERVGLASPGARPVAPELEEASASGVRVLCLYGERDNASICPATRLPNLRAIELKGGHGLADDHRTVSSAILGEWNE